MADNQNQKSTDMNQKSTDDKKVISPEQQKKDDAAKTANEGNAKKTA